MRATVSGPVRARAAGELGLVADAVSCKERAVYGKDDVRHKQHSQQLPRSRKAATPARASLRRTRVRRGRKSARRGSSREHGWHAGGQLDLADDDCGWNAAAEIARAERGVRGNFPCLLPQALPRARAARRSGSNEPAP